MTALAFFVPGFPAPQGSKRHVGNGVMVESSKRVKPWREDVRQTALLAAGGAVFAGPTLVTLRFVFPTLKSDPYRAHHTTRPDVDKLVRSTLDALVSSGVLKDDSLVFSLQANKFHGARAGVHVELEDFTVLAASMRERAKDAAAEARKAARAS